MRRHSPEEIDIDWLCEAITKSNNGVKLTDICAKAKINHEGRVIYSKISENTFRKAVKLRAPIPYHPPKGRKPEEIDLDAAQAFCNFKDQMPNTGINKIIQKIQTDLTKIESHPQEFQQIKENFQNANLFTSGNWLKETDRISLVTQVPKSYGPVLKTNSVEESLISANYIEKPCPHPSYRMGRKIYEALIKEPPENQEITEQKYKPRNYVATKCHEIWHADIHYWRGTIGQYLYAIIDDRSRKIIDYQLMKEKTDHNTAIILERALQTIPGYPYAIWTDNGKKNFGEFSKLCKKHSITQIFIKPGNPQANGKIEKWWPNAEKNCRCNEDIPKVIHFYNNMPHASLPINPITGVHFTPTDFEDHEKDLHWYLDQNQEAYWEVDGQVISLKESIENFTTKE